jgi:hypothetical protein
MVGVHPAMARIEEFTPEILQQEKTLISKYNEVFKDEEEH